MLLHIKAVYRCDSCHKIDEWLMGNEWSSWNGSLGCLDGIFQCIKEQMLPGWVKSEYNHWCNNCHMKKDIKTKETK